MTQKTVGLSDLVQEWRDEAALWKPDVPYTQEQVEAAELAEMPPLLQQKAEVWIQVTTERHANQLEAALAAARELDAAHRGEGEREAHALNCPCCFWTNGLAKGSEA